MVDEKQAPRHEWKTKDYCDLIGYDMPDGKERNQKVLKHFDEVGVCTGRLIISKD